MNISFYKNLGLRFLVASIPIVIILSVALFQGFKFFTDNIIDALSERFAEQQVLYDRSRTLQPLLQEIVLARKLARSQTIIDWALNEQDKAAQKRGLAELESARSIFRDGSYFFAIDNSGRYFFNDAKNAYAGRQFRYILSPEKKDDAWYYATLKNPQECQLNINNDSELKVTKVWINCLVKDGENPIGVIGTGIELSSFIRYVLDSNQEGVVNTFIDGDGAIQAHPDETFIDFSTLTKEEEKKKTIYRLLSDEPSRHELRTILETIKRDPDKIRTVYMSLDGADRLLGIAYLKEIDWFNITIITPKIWALGQSFAPLAVLAVSGSVLTLVFVIILLHRFILRRISRLDKATHQIANKQYQLSLNDDIPDEIGRLTNSFVKMAGAVYKERQALEQKVEDRTRELKEARDKAEMANLSKSQFLASMSHEIRTPMTGVVGFADMLLDENLPSTSKEKVEQIKSSAKSLLNLINDILDTSKLEAGKMEIEHIDFALIELVEETCELIKQSRKKKNVKFTLIFDQNFPASINSDPSRLRQILVNLIGNAIKFTDKGYVNIKGEKLTVDGNKEAIKFTIDDTGIGMSEEILKSLFDQFTQADASISRRFEGSGLGLTICKKLVELMGGKIDVESKIGVGSTFWFILPYEPARTDLLESKNTQQIISYQANRELNILLAEDNRVNQLIIKKFIENYGHVLTIVDNGLEAVEDHRNHYYDLILMDIRMPEMNGTDATKTIRQMNGDKSEIPIIAVTADAMKDHEQAYYEVGMNGYVAKPIEQNDLILAINDAMGEEIHSKIKTHAES